MLENIKDDSLVLIIEDETNVRDTVSQLLELEGFQAVATSNAEDGLKYLKKSVLPSLILLDLGIPGMSPSEFMAQKKQDPRLDKIPVIVLSADDQVKGKAVAIGADEYFKKPVDIDVFLEALDRYCKAAQRSIWRVEGTRTLH